MFIHYTGIRSVKAASSVTARCHGVEHAHTNNTVTRRLYKPLPVRRGCGAPVKELMDADCAIPGDEGVLLLGRMGPSPLMMSCIDASRASTRSDICRTT